MEPATTASLVEPHWTPGTGASYPDGVLRGTGCSLQLEQGIAMRSNRGLRTASVMVGVALGLAVAPISPASAATGGGCGGWTHFINSGGTRAEDANAHACISYSGGKVKPDVYVNFSLERRMRIDLCTAVVRLYKKVGTRSVQQNKRTYDCTDDAQARDTGVRYGGGQAETSSGEYWTVLDIDLLSSSEGRLFKLHTGSPHVKP